MLEQVEQKIQELKKLQAEEYYRKKDEDLSAWGLTTKKDGKKATPIIVTDDEYEALIKASNGVTKSGRNSVANMLKTFSVAILVVGAGAGGAIWAMSETKGFIWFSVALIAAATLSLLFYGISTAIALLQQLLDLNPLQKPDPLHTRIQPNNAPNMGSQYMATRPPVYQAAAYRQPVAQPYYGAVQQPVMPQPVAPQPVVPQPVAPQPVAPQPAPVQEVPSYGAPQNYNEMGTFEREIQDDFFLGTPYEASLDSSERK